MVSIKELDSTPYFDEINRVMSEGMERSPGLHVSEIYRDLAIRAGLLDDSDDNPPPNNHTTLGFIWETVIEKALRNLLPDGVTRPGEFIVDGIACSPDGVDKFWRVHEYKCTWKSSNHDIQDKKHWMWMVQIRAYCYVMNATRARLHVFFVNGDYRGSGPQLKVWDLEFTQRELDENWKMLVNHAKSKGWLGMEDGK